MRWVRAFLRGFGCAFRGIGRTVREERNFRIHLTAVSFVILFGIWYEVTAFQAAVLAIVCGIVLVAELLNSAVEAAVDFCSCRLDPLAKKAKDAGAGAVLVTAMLSVAVFVILFRDPAHWMLVWDKLRFPGGLIPAALAVGGILFVCWGGNGKSSGERPEDTERNAESE